MMPFRFLLILCFLSVSMTAHARPEPKAKPAAQETLGMVTGPATGTSLKIGKDIAEIVKPYGVQLDVKESQGSIDNLRRINSRENAGLGIVQSDLLGYLRRSEDPASKKLSENLRLLFPFYQEEVHVLARADIPNIKALEGKRVAVGEVGSGHWLTAMNLFTMFGIKPGQMLRLPPAEAVAAVLQNKADALIFVGGKPVKLFQNLQDLTKQPDSGYAAMLQQVHFLPLQDPKLENEYASAQLTPADYGFLAAPVPTIAVRAMLVGYDFSEGTGARQKARCTMVGKIGQALKEQLPKLQQSGHEKWKEVNFSQTNIGLWERDRCVDLHQKAAAPTAPAVDPLEKHLLETIKQRW
jgi:TRAP transporter TAXI family solute receptor